MEQGILVPLGLHEQLSGFTSGTGSTPGSLLRVPTAPNFYTSWLITLTILCFKTHILVAVNEVSILRAVGAATPTRCWGCAASGVHMGCVHLPEKKRNPCFGEQIEIKREKDGDKVVSHLLRGWQG